MINAIEPENDGFFGESTVEDFQKTGDSFSFRAVGVGWRCERSELSLALNMPGIIRTPENKRKTVWRE